MFRHLVEQVTVGRVDQIFTCVCVLFHFNYEDHDKYNKITIIIEAATRLMPVHVDVK